MPTVHHNLRKDEAPTPKIDILNSTPIRFRCPVCGRWHAWKGKALHLYDSLINSYSYECNATTFNIWLKNNIIYFCAEDLLCKYNYDINIASDLRDIRYDGLYSEITIPFTLDEDELICGSECRTCNFYERCNIVNSASNFDDYEKSIYNLELKISFLGSETSTAECKKNLTQTSKTKRNMHQEDVSEQTKSQKTNQIKEETTMENNNLNINMEFGPNTDGNIASSFMGVAVKNGKNWRIYDKKSKEIIDIGNIEFANLPLFILPTLKLSEGDLIKDNGNYYFVTKMSNDGTETLCAKTGEIKKIIPVKNLLGISCYSKVIALSDSIGKGTNIDIKKGAIMSMMCAQPGQNNGQMSSMLPLLFLGKDKLGADDDMMNMLLMTSMMGGNAAGNEQMNQMLPLLFLGKDTLNADDDMMNMLLMTSMMGGNAANNNPLMSYLMLNMLNEKKDDEKPKELQQPDQPLPQTPVE